MPSFIGIIPARYASSRFPGKPLADIKGKTMIQRVYERAGESLEHVVVATDDTRIEKAVLDFGGKAVMTSPNHKSGTDRCFEAYTRYAGLLGSSFDVVINIQGDEPFVRKEQIEDLKACFADGATHIATLIRLVGEEAVILDPNRPKVVTDNQGFALYFSRSPVPYLRDAETGSWHLFHKFYQHLGMYAYRSDVLAEITRLPIARLEKAESLEQLRWLENGYRIKTAETLFESFGIDTPEDLKKALESDLI
ncbi:MAG: 3-deoxy-manno-octulosonate cytidylyltransferase [Bacteroidales bacterium]|nr:3-deoxy-manno-octulosonate cytidylyltransferase [Bacteroidales bacterium]